MADTVAESREQLAAKIEDTLQLTLDADGDERASLNNLRRQLQDLDDQLFQAPFLDNDTRISQLVQKIDEQSAEAQKIVDVIREIKNTIKTLRQQVAVVSGQLQQAVPLLNEVEALVDGMLGNGNA